MNTQIIIEAVGYAGSLLVVISMLMSSVKKLRIVNGIGSIIFSVYAFIIHSYPTALMNLFLVGINIVNLVKIYKEEKNFKILECFKDESIVQQYLSSQLEDIRKFFPEFSLEEGGHLKAFLVFSGSRPVGISIGTLEENNIFNLQLDYSIPEYRDCSVGEFIYKYFSQTLKIKTLVQKNPSEEHEEYLLNMGFAKTDEGFVKTLLPVS